MPMTSADRQHRWNILIAFALLYFFWGSTYLAIRMAVMERALLETRQGGRA